MSYIDYFNKGAASEDAVPFYVSTDGLDENTGTKSSPWLTLAGAQTGLRAYVDANGLPDGGVIIYLRAGTYRLTSTLALTYSGAIGGPIIWRAYPDETVYVTGGIELEYSWFNTLANDSYTQALYDRLPVGAQGNVLYVDLGAAAQANLDVDTDVGELQKRQSNSGDGHPVWDWTATGPEPPAELLVDGESMTLGESDIDYTNNVASLVFEARDDATLVDDFADEEEPWCIGWYKVTYFSAKTSCTLDDVGNTVTLTNTGADMRYGDEIEEGDAFKLINLFKEVDEAGRYYIARDGDGKGGLFLYPPDGWTSGSRILLSQLIDPLITLTDASNVQFDGIIFESGRGDGIQLSGGSNIMLTNCTIRGMGQHGLSIDDTDYVTLNNVEINGCGDCNVYTVDMGDINSLDSSHFYAANSIFRDFRRANPAHWKFAAVTLQGVGFHLDQCDIKDGPSQAIRFFCCKSLIERCDVDNTCFAIGDAGPLYSGADGKSPAWQGNVIRDNLIQNFNRTQTKDDTYILYGVYLDEGASGFNVYKNRFYNSTGMAIFVSGGRDNRVVNNAIEDCARGIRIAETSDTKAGDANDLVAALNSALGGTSLWQTLPAWVSEFPWLARMPATWAGWADHFYKFPIGTIVARNIGHGTATGSQAQWMGEPTDIDSYDYTGPGDGMPWGDVAIPIGAISDGPFLAGETVQETGSDAKGVLCRAVASDAMHLLVLSGTFVGEAVLTGLGSGATCTGSAVDAVNQGSTLAAAINIYDDTDEVFENASGGDFDIDTVGFDVPAGWETLVPYGEIGAQ